MRTLIVALALFPSLALAQWGPGVRVNVAPPPVRVEVRPVAPSPGHVWNAGHWQWNGRRHVWMPGHWAMPPQAGHRWVEARWVNEGGRWVFYAGHWEAGAPVVVQQPVQLQPVAPPQPMPPPEPVAPEIIVEQPPPAPIVEVRPASPYAGAVWIPGFWTWHGHKHHWVRGHWERGQAGRMWHDAQWVRMPNGRWRHVPGYWQ